MAAVKPIPDEYQGATPYIIVHDAAAALDFYRDAFGAVENGRMVGPDGRVGHSEISIGAARVMCADEFPEMNMVSPKTLGGTTFGMTIYVEDVDTVFAKAVANGATVIQPLEDKFYGDRSGQVEDPFGHKWSFATHVEDVSEEEMEKRAAAFFEAQT